MRCSVSDEASRRLIAQYRIHPLEPRTDRYRVKSQLEDAQRVNGRSESGVVLSIWDGFPVGPLSYDARGRHVPDVRNQSRAQHAAKSHDDLIDR